MAKKSKRSRKTKAKRRGCSCKRIPHYKLCNCVSINIEVEKDLSFRDALYIFLFYFLATWFMLAMIRFSVFLPELLKSNTGKIFDPFRKISDPNEQQKVLVLSEYGILSWYLFPALIFILLGIFIFSSSNKTLQKNWVNIFSTTIFVVLGICISIFSIWRA